MRQYYRNEIVFAFSYMIAKEYDSNKINDFYKNDDKDFYFNKNAFGNYFKIISAKDLLSGNFKKNDIKGKIVLLGHFSDKEDSFYLDHTKTKRISGVEFHACIIKDILD